MADRDQGAQRQAASPPGVEELAQLGEACGYSEDDDDGSVESLIAYKNALEDDYLRLAAKAAAWDAVDQALRRNARGPLSAADVCAVGFDQQLRLAK